MSSISLPKVLHPRRTSLDIERESFEKAQLQALTKAISKDECPVKQKHVRSAIIGTFHVQGATVFWPIALRLPALEDRIVAWKLCHVIHTVLREGHPMCLLHSQRYRKDLDEIGKLWGHLKEGYGKMIRLYTALLITKLDFHRRNPRFPGHLGVSPEELDSIGGNDINTYFEISVEMFDYIDNILDLQEAVFGSLDMARSNSMTSAGQCRLSPLIPCIQDASKLYDYCVKSLFKLHFSLPPDTLSGHRHRFLKQFKVLKTFYQNTSNLQYFKDLIAISPLPENPPNFLIQSDLRTYITQEVVVPEVSVDQNLVDTSEVTATNEGQISILEQQNQQLLLERAQLEKQNFQLQRETTELNEKFKKAQNILKKRITELTTELTTKDNELAQERHDKEELMNQTFAVAQSQDSEQRVKDEKFNKLKDIYYKLRDDHIQKLREKADGEKKLSQISKMLSTAEEQREELQLTVNQLQQKLTDLDHQRSEQQCSELENLKKEKELFDMETEILKRTANEVNRECDRLKFELQRLSKEKDDKIDECTSLVERIKHMENEFKTIELNANKRMADIYSHIIGNAIEMTNDAQIDVDTLDLIAVSCSLDYIKQMAEKCKCLLSNIRDSSKSHDEIVVQVNFITHYCAYFMRQQRTICNASGDIGQTERLLTSCTQWCNSLKKLLRILKENSNSKSDYLPLVDEIIDELKHIEQLSGNIVTSAAFVRLGNNKFDGQTDEEMLEQELQKMDKAIDEANKRFQAILASSPSSTSSVIKLQVNAKILDSSTTLMNAVRLLVQKSRLLQSEIVSQGRGTATDKEFYKRNHKWTEGLISAAKAVATAANFFVSAADKVVTSHETKLEQLVVAAQEIAAATAQLVVASRVKADRKSDNLAQLTSASKDVTTATGNVIATVRDCNRMIDDTSMGDILQVNANGNINSHITSIHQAKRMEMEVQVRVLELEKDLEQERYRLAALRKRHYQLEDDGGGKTEN